jgi:uncharacterized protein YkwD
MRTNRFVRRTAALAIMVASAALPAGVAHSAASGEAPAVTTQSGPVSDWGSTQGWTVADLGLPTKPIAARPVVKSPSVDTLTRVAAAPAPAAAPPSTTPQKATTTTAKTTTTKAKSSSTGSTAAKTTTTTKSPAVSTPQAPAVAPAPAQSSVTARQDLAASVAAATNAQRVAAGLSALSYRSCSVPASWAVHMASAGSLTHNSLMTVLSSCGGKSTAGENIAAGYTSVSAVTSGWMGSAGHKANILNPNFKIISVGVAQAANGTFYWVEDFTG